jgi:1-acyl-sn-glycerol-3-phosphate acyltransferase
MCADANLRSVTGPWHRFVASLVTRVFFERVDLVTAAGQASLEGPVVWVALHRNGAVDGWVYMRHIPRLTFLIAGQLRKSVLARVFFSGIEIVRSGDAGDRSGNEQAIRQCVEHVRSGQGLGVFPEGTSSLGPRNDAGKIPGASVATTLYT